MLSVTTINYTSGRKLSFEILLTKMQTFQPLIVLYICQCCTQWELLKYYLNSTTYKFEFGCRDQNSYKLFFDESAILGVSFFYV